MTLYLPSSHSLIPYLIKGMKMLFWIQECPRCREIVRVGTLGVFAPKFGDGVAWHPSCFMCTTCDELLVDLTYCNFDDVLYCERHYAEQIRPRCAACDEVNNQFVHLYIIIIAFKLASVMLYLIQSLFINCCISGFKDSSESIPS